MPPFCLTKKRRRRRHVEAEHHWSQWCAAYIVARVLGLTPEEAATQRVVTSSVPATSCPHNGIKHGRTLNHARAE